RSRARTRILPAERRLFCMFIFWIPLATSATLSGCSSNSDLDEPCAGARPVNLQPGHADWKTETAWSGVPWIEKQDPIGAFNGRSMGMPADDDLNLRVSALRQFFDIVQHEDGNVLNLNCLPGRYAPRPIAGIVVSSN